MLKLKYNILFFSHSFILVVSQSHWLQLNWIKPQTEMMCSQNPGGFNFCVRLRISQSPLWKTGGCLQLTALVEQTQPEVVHAFRGILFSKKVLLFILSLIAIVNIEGVSAISAFRAVKVKKK